MSRAAATTRVTEQRVAELVVAHLEGCGHDVYQEVAVGGGVADIVAKAGPEIWIVEVKTGWSLELIEQCVARRHQCHRVFAATLPGRHGNRHEHIARELRIGVLHVYPSAAGDRWSPTVRVDQFPPRLTSHRLALADKLRPEHKTHAKAGAVGAAGRYTPFRATCDEVRAYVRSAPGATIKDVVNNTRHHYGTPATARSCIAKWAEKGVIDGVEARRDEHGRITLWLAMATGAASR